jgi:hypothetical protein
MTSKKQDIIDSAKRTLHYSNLLIEQCDSWLSAEEGNKAQMKKIRLRQKEKSKKRWAWIFRLFGFRDNDSEF